METVGIRELQQHASAVLRRIARGEVLGVTDRGRLVAVLQPPSSTSGAAALVAAGRVRAASAHDAWLPEPISVPEPSQSALDDLRSDRA